MSEYACPACGRQLLYSHSRFGRNWHCAGWPSCPTITTKRVDLKQYRRPKEAAMEDYENPFALLDPEPEEAPPPPVEVALAEVVHSAEAVPPPPEEVATPADEPEPYVTMTRYEWAKALRCSYTLLKRLMDESVLYPDGYQPTGKRGRPEALLRGQLSVCKVEANRYRLPAREATA